MFKATVLENVFKNIISKIGQRKIASPVTRVTVPWKVKSEREGGEEEKHFKAGGFSI
jgi:hypothetical protein